jgi:hypothetical protein
MKIKLMEPPEEGVVGDPGRLAEQNQLGPQGVSVGVPETRAVVRDIPRIVLHDESFREADQMGVAGVELGNGLHEFPVEPLAAAVVVSAGEGMGG